MRKITEEEEEDDGEDELGDDAFEALFAQLEMDLEADDSSDIEDFTEEELVDLEKELSEALTDIDYEEEQLAAPEGFIGDVDSDREFDDDDRRSVGRVDNSGPSSKSLPAGENKRGGRKTTRVTEEEIIDVPLDDFEEEEEEEEQRIVDLQPWQLKKLAAAVELGRRKVNVSEGNILCPTQPLVNTFL